MTETAVRPEGAQVNPPVHVDVNDGKQGIGGRPASGEPASSAAKVLNGDSGADARWVKPGFEDLSKKVLAARESIGRPTLAGFAEASQSAIWRWERDRITHAELETVQALVKRIDAGELPAPKAKGKTSTVKQAVTRIDEVLTALADPSKGSKVNVPKLLTELREILDPQS